MQEILFNPKYGYGKNLDPCIDCHGNMYALNVIQDKEELGDCPIIGVLLMLFKKKNIPIEDIFIICVHLKNAFLHYLLEKNLLTKDILSEINHVMDYNFNSLIFLVQYIYYKYTNLLNFRT